MHCLFEEAARVCTLIAAPSATMLPASPAPPPPAAAARRRRRTLDACGGAL